MLLLLSVDVALYGDFRVGSWATFWLVCGDLLGGNFLAVLATPATNQIYGIQGGGRVVRRTPRQMHHARPGPDSQQPYTALSY